MVRNIGILTCIALVAACVSAAADLGFERVDEDDDQALTRAEFREFLDDTDLWENYDDDDDARLSRQEYAEAVDDELDAASFFVGFDRNRDDELDMTEFSDGIFDVFDRADDGLNEDEFEAAVAALEIEL